MEYKRYYEKQNFKGEFQNKDTKEQPEYVTPQTFLMSFRAVKEAIEKLEPHQVNQEVVYNKLNKLLNKNCIEFLLSWGDINVNTQIINEVLLSCKPLSFPYVESLSIKLAQLAGTDNETIIKIHTIVKQKKLKSYWDRYKAIITIGAAILFFIGTNYLGNLTSSSHYDDARSRSNVYNNSQPPNTYPNYSIISNDTLASYHNSTKAAIKNTEDYKDWDVKEYSSGSSPGCYSYIPRYDNSIDNKLEVTVGSSTNVIIKVVNIKKNKCIRYVYIRGGETYEIRNIPEGKYYLKIAFGRDWREKKVDTKCIGKFVSNSLYKKGDEVLDFNLIYDGIKTEGNKTFNSYRIPSYSLKLDVLTTYVSDQFKSTEISEDEFDDEKN